MNRILGLLERIIILMGHWVQVSLYLMGLYLICLVEGGANGGLSCLQIVSDG